MWDIERIHINASRFNEPDSAIAVLAVTCLTKIADAINGMTCIYDFQVVVFVQAIEVVPHLIFFINLNRYKLHTTRMESIGMDGRVASMYI